MLHVNSLVAEENYAITLAMIRVAQPLWRLHELPEAPHFLPSLVQASPESLRSPSTPLGPAKCPSLSPNPVTTLSKSPNTSHTPYKPLPSFPTPSETILFPPQGTFKGTQHM